MQIIHFFDMNEAKRSGMFFDVGESTIEHKKRLKIVYCSGNVSQG